MFQTTLFISFIVPLVAGLNLGRTQSAGARGVLLCHGKPEPNVLIKLYDDDSGVDTDDLMASAYTNAQGFFELSGTAHEFLTIDPKLNVYHDCDDRIVPCQRKFSIELPSSYVYSGELPERFYNLGTLELSGKFGDESRDCIH